MVAVEDTWAGVIEDWCAVRKSSSGELAQAVLLSIFCDPDVLKALELANVMSTTRGGEVPPGMLTILKQKLGKHMKDNYYLYMKEIQEEISHIERIQDLKSRMIALMGSTFVAVLVGLSNFVSQYAYDWYMGSDDDNSN